MKASALIGLVTSTISLSAVVVLAQGSVGPGEDARTMMMIMGKERSFTAAMAGTIQYEGEAAENVGEKRYFMSQGKTRTEEDITLKRSLKPEQVAAIKKADLAQMVSIYRLDKQAAYVLIPGKKSYFKTDLRDMGFDSAAKPPKVERKEVGKETIEGHPCVKVQLTITSSEGEKDEMMVWEATDLDRLPIRLDSTGANNKSSVVFRKVKLGKIDPALFEVPADYKELTQDESVALGAMMMQLEMGDDSGAPSPPSKTEAAPKKP